MSALRVGSPPYLVNRPLDHGLERDFELVHDVPSRLIERLRAGELDVALASSIELFRRPGYRYIPGAAIVGRGGVSSVQVFLRCELERVRSVVLDPASRAAQTLARIELIARLGRGRVNFSEPAPDSDPREVAHATNADAWLAIGDRALRTKLGPDAPPSFDPAAAWFARTKLPFAFAVWIVRPGVELERGQIEAFHAARDRGRAALPELAREAGRTWLISEAACLRYLAEECGFAPGEELEQSLLRLRDSAAALELARPDLSPIQVAFNVPASHR